MNKLLEIDKLYKLSYRNVNMGIYKVQDNGTLICVLSSGFFKVGSDWYSLTQIGEEGIYFTGREDTWTIEEL